MTNPSPSASTKQQTARRIHSIYGGILAALVLITAASFAVACYALYQTGGDDPFTYERIGAAFAKICVPIVLCLLGIIGGVIVNCRFPIPNKSPKAEPNARVLLKRMERKLDGCPCSEKTFHSIQAERRLRKICYAAAAVACLAAIAVCVFGAVTVLANRIAEVKTSLGSEHQTPYIKAAALVVFPSSLIALGAILASVLIADRSIVRELALVKSALAEQPGGTVCFTANRTPLAPTAQKRPTVKWIVRIALLCVGVLFVVLGILNGGMADVLGKAIRICTECIGLG